MLLKRLGGAVFELIPPHMFCLAIVLASQQQHYRPSRTTSCIDLNSNSLGRNPNSSSTVCLLIDWVVPDVKQEYILCYPNS